MPTAFIGTYGDKDPEVGINVEYDCLPGLSQQLGYAEKKTRYWREHRAMAALIIFRNNGSNGGNRIEIWDRKIWNRCNDQNVWFTCRGIMRGETFHGKGRIISGG